MEPHVLFLPLPIRGHVKPMLTLAELISQAGLRVTFVNSHHNQQAHLDSSTVVDIDRHPKFRFVSLSDGLPPDVPRSGRRVAELMFSTREVMKPEFRRLLAGLISGGDGGKSKQPPSCIIADAFMSFGVEFGEEFGIPVISFSLMSASSTWTFCNLPRLAKEGLIPFKGDDMDEAITCIPGLEGVLKRRDFPGPGKVVQHSTHEQAPRQFSLTDMITTLRASSLILNTVEELEAPAVAELASVFPKVYSLGPLHALLESPNSSTRSSSSSSRRTILGKEDRSCLSWLDTKPARSVLFVSFGSLVCLTSDQTLELWHGLVNSGKPFLWVKKPGDEVALVGEEDDQLLHLATRERGCIVDWAPQVEVLAHPSVGGFVTHSGWNSTMESVFAGVPMICWPGMGDQFVNRRLVADVWGVGLDMEEDKCSGGGDRVGVEKMVRELMEEKKEELMVSMDEVSRKARESVKEGGSSYGQLNKLVQDLRSMASNMYK